MVQDTCAVSHLRDRLFEVLFQRCDTALYVCPLSCRRLDEQVSLPGLTVAERRDIHDNKVCDRRRKIHRAAADENLAPRTTEWLARRLW